MKCWCLSRHCHDSGMEATDCNRLLSDKQHGKIKDYWIQKSVPLHINGKTWKSWKIDFLVERMDGTFFYMETKGVHKNMGEFRLKLNAFMVEYPDREIQINWRPSSLSAGGRIMCDGFFKKIQAQRDAKRAGKFKNWKEKIAWIQRQRKP